jgi:hypothetical protein
VKPHDNLGAIDMVKRHEEVQLNHFEPLALYALNLIIHVGIIDLTLFIRIVV